MNTDKLIHMANRIGEFFAAMPVREEALAGVAEHLCKFWEPRMRRQLLARLDADAASGSPNELHEMVQAAVAAHRRRIEPAQPTEVAPPSASA